MSQAVVTPVGAHAPHSSLRDTGPHSSLRDTGPHSSLRDMVSRSGTIVSTMIVNSGLGYVFWRSATRSMSGPSVGRAAALLGLVQILALVGSCGFGSSFYSLSVQHRQQRWGALGSRAFTWAAGASAAVSATVLSAVHIVRPQLVATVEEVIFLTVFGVITTLGLVFDDLCLSDDLSKVTFLRNGVASTCKLAVLVVVASIHSATTIHLLVAWMTGTILSVGVAFSRVRSQRSVRLRPTLRLDRGSTPGGVPWHLVSEVGGRLPLLLLPTVALLRQGAIAANELNLAWLTASPLFAISPAVSQVAMVLSHDGGRMPAVKRAAKLLTITFAVALPIAYLGRNIGRAFFGAGYNSNSATLFVLLLLSAVPDAISNVWISYRRALGAMKGPAFLNISMGVGTLGLAALAIPSFGIRGAGLAWLVVQTLGVAAIGIDHLNNTRRRQHATTPEVWNMP